MFQPLNNAFIIFISQSRRQEVIPALWPGSVFFHDLYFPPDIFLPYELPFLITHVEQSSTVTVHTLFLMTCL